MSARREWSACQTRRERLAWLPRRAPRLTPPAPLAVEAVRQIDAIFAHERTINGHAAADRLA